MAIQRGDIMMICRMDDADNLSGQLLTRKPGAFTKWTILTVVLFFFALVAMGFALMDDTLTAKLTATALGALSVLCFVNIYRSQKAADRYFLAYLFDDDVNSAVVMEDIVRACTNDTLFGAEFSVTFGREHHNWGRIASNLKNINTCSKVDEFLQREDVVKYCGTVIEEVHDIKETKKEYHVRAKLRRLDTKHFFVVNYTGTIRIPKSHINSDALTERLRMMI